MSLSELAEYHFSQRKKCKKCQKLIRNNNTSGLCFECHYGFKHGYKNGQKKDKYDDVDLKLLIEDE